MEPTIQKGERDFQEDVPFDEGMPAEWQALDHQETLENPPAPEEESNSELTFQEAGPAELPQGEETIIPESAEPPNQMDEQPVLQVTIPDGLIATQESPIEPSFVEEITPPLNEEPLNQIAVQEVVQAPNPHKVALILSGGGARGAFQVGAEMYAREAKGYQWDIIGGVSVGAMNAAMLAMHHYTRLLELWDHISADQVYTGGFNLISLVKIIFGAKSFYGVEPLKKLMQQELESGRILEDLHVGAVSLISGEYVQFTRESMELSKAILASAAIPVIFSPVDVSPDYPSMVDGGVRNLTPIGDVLSLEPDEIVIINCGREQPAILPQAPQNVLTIGLRTVDLMQNEIFVNDMKSFLRINALVKQAEEQGTTLHHPKSGRPFKYIPCQIIEPERDLGGILDFSQKSIQASLKEGVKRARDVLGRP